MDAISEAVLEEMKATSEASGSDSIMDNYRESFLVKDRTVKLADSGFYAVFGNISAKKYLTFRTHKPLDRILEVIWFHRYPYELAY